MKVAQNKVVTLEYQIRNAQGEVVEDTSGNPLQYIQGIGQLLPALEQALEGKEAGEEVEITLTPDQAFGEYDEGQIQAIPKSAFGEGMELQPGMVMYARTQDGHQVPFLIREVREDVVIADFNHPLAGETLTFHLKVMDVRDATPEELAHGHVHGPDAHSH